MSRDPEVHSGDAVFSGTRVPVERFWASLAAGRSGEDFLAGYPAVERWQVEAAVRRSNDDEERRAIVEACRATVARNPLEPVLMQRLREIIHDEDVLVTWLCSQSGWLGGHRPLDLWREDPESVITAARRAVEPLEV